MPNINDYLSWRGDLSFAADPLNEVDALVFSVLAYLDMDGLVPESIDEAIRVHTLSNRYQAAGFDQTALITDPSIALRSARDTERIGQARVFAFRNTIDADRLLQFSAVSFLLPGGEVFVAFRGTDDNIVGWREDVALVYNTTEGQRMAARYLSYIGGLTSGRLYVGGHSKGGNFAEYAAAFCDSGVQERILCVFSNDGPGLSKELTESDPYRRIADRILLIQPEGSVVGALLSHGGKTRYIKSSEHGGIGQHHPYSWQVQGGRFVYADARSSSGALIDETVSKWVDSLSPYAVEQIEKAVFEPLGASGAETLTQLSDKENRLRSMNVILSAARGLDTETARSVTESLKSLSVRYRDVLWDETKKLFRKTDG